MSLTTITAYKIWLADTSVNAARDSAWSAMLLEAEDAVKKYLRQGIESASYTSYISGGPFTTFVLPQVPVSLSGFAVYRNDSASGDPADFGADNLLTMYEDYVLDTSPADNSTSVTGMVRSLAGAWGYYRERPLGTLASKWVLDPKNIKVTYTAGYATVPASIVLAVHLLTSKIWHMRKRGFPVTSESLNGYSYSAQGTATAEGILQGDPTIKNLLRPFGRQFFVGSYF
jgi:hypothetical protein